LLPLYFLSATRVNMPTTNSCLVLWENPDQLPLSSLI
jgi:hypothetical protein